MERKRSLGRIFLVHFLRTMGVIILFVGIGVISYFITSQFFKSTTRDERSTHYKHVLPIDIGAEASNLVYSVDSETARVKAIVLELFDKETGNVDFITIPNKTQISLTPQAYKKYSEISSGIPQIVTLADINQYFSGDVAYEYGALLLQEELDIDIDFFTMMNQVEFDKRFDKKKGAYTLSEEYRDLVFANKDENAMKNFMKSEWDHVVSDLTLNQRQTYASSYLKIKRKCIKAYRARADESLGYAALNKKETEKKINNFWEEGERQEKAVASLKPGATPSVAFKHSVQITNGSNITGLAAHYQTKLQAAGFKVSGIGNLVGDIQTKTVIYGNKLSWAKKLAPYFNNPQVVEKMGLTNNADVEIVLGTDDGVDEKDMES